MQDLVSLSIRQFTEAWRVFCTAPAGHAAESRAGAEFLCSGLPAAFFNVAVITARTVSREELAAHGKAAVAWFRGRGVPWFLVVTHEALPPDAAAADVLGDSGFVPAVPLTGMLAGAITPPGTQPPELELSQPAGDAGCGALISVNSAAYGVRPEAGASALGSHRLWRNHFAAVGKLDGKPVTCAAALHLDGHRYVAFVATDPAYQRRGYAAAAMRYSLDLAARAHGPLPSVLHATEAGRPVYERMGYRRIAIHTMFSSAGADNPTAP